MKKLIFIYFLFLSVNLIGQNCIPAAIVFDTQEEVDQFPANYPSCSIIDGSVGVTGSVQNLDSLSGITFIGGNLLIQNVPQLVDISGLDNIDSIGGFLEIKDPVNLVNFNGMPSLEKIGSDLRLTNLRSNNIDDFSSITNIVGNLIIVHTSSPTNLNIDGFDNLSTLNGSLTLEGNVESNSFFEALTSVGLDFTIEDAQLLDTLRLPNLISISGSLRIDNTSLRVIENSSIENIGLGLGIYSNLNLDSIIFDGLETVGSGIGISNNSSLDLIEFPILSLLGGFGMSGNSSLLSLQTFNNLTQIGTITISNNNSLSLINSFNGLTQATNISITSGNNSSLIEFEGFDALKGANNLNFNKSPFSKFKAFSNLEQVNDIFFFNNAHIDSIEFNSLLNVSEKLRLANCSSLKHIGFSNLISVRDLEIRGSTILETIDKFENLQTISGLLTIRNNNFLTFIEGFNALTSVGNIDINTNQFLASVEGFDHPFDIIGSLKVNDNPFLDLCSVQAICDHLSQSSFSATISNNGPNCNSVNSILANCPNPPDTDGDGVPDYEDNCDNTSNPDQADANNNGVGDACEPFADSDGDGVVNADDNCPDDFNPDQADSDDDGTGDVCDFSDSDGDGISDFLDNCPSVFNPDQADTNNNEIGDLCDDSDSDFDGIADSVDNCPGTSNADQLDSDGDGIGDVCEPPLDEDGDGVADSSDNCLDFFNPDQIDLNGNGIGDACEVTYKVGVGTDDPLSELHISNGNVFIDNPAKGIIFKSIDGNCYLQKVKKVNGIVRSTIAEVPCPQ